jgi:hypothetical protein
MWLFADGISGFDGISGARTVGIACGCTGCAACAWQLLPHRTQLCSASWVCCRPVHCACDCCCVVFGCAVHLQCTGFCSAFGFCRLVHRACMPRALCRAVLCLNSCGCYQGCCTSVARQHGAFGQIMFWNCAVLVVFIHNGQNGVLSQSSNGSMHLLHYTHAHVCYLGGLQSPLCLFVISLGCCCCVLPRLLHNSRRVAASSSVSHARMQR